MFIQQIVIHSIFLYTKHIQTHKAKNIQNKWQPHSWRSPGVISRLGVSLIIYFAVSKCIALPKLNSGTIIYWLCDYREMYLNSFWPNFPIFKNGIITVWSLRSKHANICELFSVVTDTCKILNKYELLLLVWNYKQMKDSHVLVFKGRRKSRHSIWIIKLKRM